MTKLYGSDKIAAEMIAIYWAGIAKDAASLRESIRALDESALFDGSLNIEAIARENEATQGIKMF